MEFNPMIDLVVLTGFATVLFGSLWALERVIRPKATERQTGATRITPKA
jgi:hypothetical protein